MYKRLNGHVVSSFSIRIVCFMLTTLIQHVDIYQLHFLHAHFYFQFAKCLSLQ